MPVQAHAQHLIQLYPRIYFACHRRHVHDPASRLGDRRGGPPLSAHQASILDHLDSQAPTHVGALASHMGVTASTMSLALDRLEAAGYIRRKRDARDTRRVGVLLTDAGERIRRANSVLDPDLVEELIRSVDPALRDRAIEGLAILAEATGRVSHDARRIDLSSSGLAVSGTSTAPSSAVPPPDSPHPGDHTGSSGGG